MQDNSHSQNFDDGGEDHWHGQARTGTNYGRRDEMVCVRGRGGEERESG